MASDEDTVPIRERVYQIIIKSQYGDRTSRFYDLFIVCVALVSLVPLMFKETNAVLAWWDLATVYILFVDYILRWLTYDYHTGRSGWRAFLSYPFTPWAIIDLLGILPSFGLLPSSFMFLRILRVFKVLRYSRSLTLVANVFKSERDTLLSVLVIALGYIFISALAMFVYEPDTFEDFFGALYWATTALTTVSYGDVYPHTDAGRVISMVSSLFGIAVIALPAGIVTGGFIDEMKRSREDPEAYYRDAEMPVATHVDAGRFLGVLGDNPRFAPSVAIMVLGCIIDVALFELANACGWPVWLDDAGTALVSFALGPYCGIAVALVNSIYLSVFHYGASNMVYFATGTLVALAYGCLLYPLRGKWRENAGKSVRDVALCVLLVTICTSLLNVAYLVWLHGGSSLDPEEIESVQLMISYGADGLLALFCGLLAVRVLDAVAVAGIVALVWRIVPKRIKALKDA